AGRSPLSRIAAPQFLPDGGSAGPVPALPEPPAETVRWNWQMALWLIPLGLLIWGLTAAVMRWRQRREDPWHALLRWGRRFGRPMAPGETVLEYGHGLADFVVLRAQREADSGRIVAREVRALSSEVSTLRYGSEAQRAGALVRAAAHWERLRHYLRRVRRG